MTTDLPPKTPGVHRWVAINSYTLTAGQAAAAHAGSSVTLGPHNLVAISIGCVDCEHEWPDTARCTAAAAPEMDDVTESATFAAPDLSPTEQERLLATAEWLVWRTLDDLGERMMPGSGEPLRCDNCGQLLAEHLRSDGLLSCRPRPGGDAALDRSEVMGGEEEPE